MAAITLLAGADIVLLDAVVPRGSLLLDGDRIAAIEHRVIDTPAGATRVDVSGLTIVPGFVDVHVHGVEDHDCLDGGGAIAAIASRLPRYGVTTFCPTSIACNPDRLTVMLDEVANLNAAVNGQMARVLPAHLESNFINPDFTGAQPLECLRLPFARAKGIRVRQATAGQAKEKAQDDDFEGDDILRVIAGHRQQVGIITVAPEIRGGIDLVRKLVMDGHRVSIGHTGATYEEALAAIDAGISHATHLFNRMTPLSHRAPGVPGAVLKSERVTAELICDGVHVHPALIDLAIRAKGWNGIVAITDGTAGSGLTVGSRSRLGGRVIVVTDKAAQLEDGTLAGSVLTMDQAFRKLVRDVGISAIAAARMCASTPAKCLGLPDCGEIALGNVADLSVLDADFRVRFTYLRGQLWRNMGVSPNV